jgi:hypothetical protein
MVHTPITGLHRRCHPVPCWSYLETTNMAMALSSHHTLLDWPKPVSSGLRAIFCPGGYLRPKGHFPTLCKRGGIARIGKKINKSEKTRDNYLCTRNGRRLERADCISKRLQPVLHKLLPANRRFGEGQRLDELGQSLFGDLIP